MIQKNPIPQGVSPKHARKKLSAFSRVDSPQYLLPSPHFDVHSAEHVFEFLDSANQTLRNEVASPNQTSRILKLLFDVTHLAKFSKPETWPESVKRFRNHTILETLHEDPFLNRSFNKPRGYSGDAVLLDYIYDHEMSQTDIDASPTGRRIHEWTTQCSACNGVKARRAFIAEFIDRLAAERNDVEILSIACGHLREADISSAILRRKLKRVVAIDSDESSINLVNCDYANLDIETISINARQMITGRMDFGNFDFVYSAGLFDYLTDRNCKQLATSWFSMLKPGGFLLLTNFVEGIEAVGFMETYMDWNLVYRNRVQMMAMTEDIAENEIAKIHYFAEENRNVICILIEKTR